LTDPRAPLHEVPLDYEEHHRRQDHRQERAADGNSTISMEDLAVALLDEAEQPRHHRTRFTAAY
jgi:putative NADH-flavin reductase